MGHTLALRASLALAASIPLIGLAFWPQYLSRPFSGLDRYTHLHALAGSLWILLLIAQSASAHARRVAAHRVLGRASYGLAPLFVVSSVLLSHHRLVSMNDATFATEGAAHFLPFYATAAFVLAYAGGLWFRRWPAAHGRFMLCTAIPLIDPVLGRTLAFYLPPFPNPWLYQVVTFGVATAVAAMVIVGFRGPATARRALVGYLAVLVGLQLGWFTVSPTAAWLAAVGWFRAVPLT
jgi:hypothetical protein